MSWTAAPRPRRGSCRCARSLAGARTGSARAFQHRDRDRPAGHGAGADVDGGRAEHPRQLRDRRPPLSPARRGGTRSRHRGRPGIRSPAGEELEPAGLAHPGVRAGSAGPLARRRTGHLARRDLHLRSRPGRHDRAAPGRRHPPRGQRRGRGQPSRGVPLQGGLRGTALRRDLPCRHPARPPARGLAARRQGLAFVRGAPGR